MLLRRAGNTTGWLLLCAAATALLAAAGSLRTTSSRDSAADTARQSPIDQPVVVPYLRAVRKELARRHARGDIVWTLAALNRAADVKPLWEQLRRMALIHVRVSADKPSAALARRVEFWLAATGLPWLKVSPAKVGTRRPGGQIEMRLVAEGAYAQLAIQTHYIPLLRRRPGSSPTRLARVALADPVDVAAFRLARAFLDWYRRELGELVIAARTARQERDRLEAAARYLLLTPDWDGLTALDCDAVLRSAYGLSPLHLLYGVPSAAVVSGPVQVSGWPLGFVVEQPPPPGQLPASIRCARDGAELVLTTRAPKSSASAVRGAVYVDRNEVTVLQYVRFLLLTGWRGQSPPRLLEAAQTPVQPATLVSWYEVTQYLQWAGRSLLTRRLWQRLVRQSVDTAWPPRLSPSAYAVQDVHPLGVINLRRGVAEWLQDCAQVRRSEEDAFLSCRFRWATPLPWLDAAGAPDPRPLPAAYRSPWLGFRGMVRVLGQPALGRRQTGQPR